MFYTVRQDLGPLHNVSHYSLLTLLCPCWSCFQPSHSPSSESLHGSLFCYIQGRRPGQPWVIESSPVLPPFLLLFSLLLSFPLIPTSSYSTFSPSPPPPPSPLHLSLLEIYVFTYFYFLLSFLPTRI